MPAENIVIGWVSRGMARSMSMTYCGSARRFLKSSTTSRVSSMVGTSPVSRNHQKPSTYG